MAKKSLGQNFLVDERVAARIVRDLAPAGETVLEIGAGRGALTTHLLAQAGRVVAIEFDRELVPVLRARFAGRDNFTLIEGDALAVDYCAAVAPAVQARVVANLPYNISTAILQRLLAARACLTELVLMLQREVVARLVAPPGTPERGYLSVLVEAYCEPEALFDVAPEAFRPVPKVWSTVVRLRLRARSAADVADETLLWQLVSAGFAQRRKTIYNNLRSAPAALAERIGAHGGAHAVLAAAELDSQRRAETLTLMEWSRLTRALEK
ncbi:MAG: 16S rRNA (adenine(1518)-N(6)/adenine(1519)-N(6))-dimethyltransferase RsmA [Pyrinomonadaceae bacterium]